MAREYGRILVSTWDDDDWTNLDPYYQGIYGALLAYKNISSCGVIDWIPKRLIKFSKAMTTQKLTDAVTFMETCDFLFLDSDTDELLVRTFVRHDGVLKMLNVGKAMARAFDEIESEKIREKIVTELGRYYVEEPELKGWEGVQEVNPELFDDVIATGSGIPS